MVIESSKYALPIRTTKTAIQDAQADIQLGMTGQQIALRTRWTAVNNMLMGGFRMDNNYLVCGASGHGKSYFLNLLHQDLLDTELNGKFYQPFKVLHFNFEMTASDEMLRKVSSKVKMSYGELLSSKRPLTKEEYDKIDTEMQKLDNDALYYVEKAGNRYEIKETIYSFHRKFPEHKLVITLDHTLLVKYLDEKSEVELLSELGKMFIEIRKDIGCCTVLVGQLNDKIEDPRRKDPSMHYPSKTDIHGSKQLFHAADTVLILHRPEMLNIAEYGLRRYPTTNIIFLHQVKARKGEIGMVRLVQDFKNGNILPFVENAYGL